MLTTAGLAVPGIHFMEIHHDEANVASGRVARRLGYAFVDARPDGIAAPAEVGTEWIWRITADTGPPELPRDGVNKARSVLPRGGARSTHLGQ